MSFIDIPKDLLIDSISSINTYIMDFLSIDCSTNINSLFVKVKNKTFIEILQSDKFGNDLLMKRILYFFVKNKLSFDDISSIYVNQGPGNFSGLRGSIATAKGISLSKKIKLFGYSTFVWSCANFLNKGNSIFSIVKFRGKYFIQKFNENLSIEIKAKKISKFELLEKFGNEFKVIPKQDAKYFDTDILKLKNINLVDLDHKELEFLQLKGLLDEKLIKPIYLS